MTLMDKSGITNPRFYVDCTREELEAREKIIDIVQELGEKHDIYICKTYFNWTKPIMRENGKPFLNSCNFGNRFDKMKQKINGVLCEEN